VERPGDKPPLRLDARGWPSGGAQKEGGFGGGGGRGGGGGGGGRIPSDPTALQRLQGIGRIRLRRFVPFPPRTQGGFDGGDEIIRGRRMESVSGGDVSAVARAMLQDATVPPNGTRRRWI